MSAQFGEGFVHADALDGLLKQAGKYRLLRAAEEIQLSKRIEKGDLAAKELLINSNIRLVVDIARRYQGQGLEMADLVQEAMLGLIRAAEKFDWRRGFRFSTYATIWIRQALQRGLDNTGRVIRLPANQAQRVRKLELVARELAAKLEREPSDIELGEALGWDLQDVHEVLEYRDIRTVSGDAGIGEDKETTLFQVWAPEGPGFEELATDVLRWQKFHAKLCELVPKLKPSDDDDKDILIMFLGIDGPAKDVPEIAWITKRRQDRVERSINSALGELGEQFERELRALHDEDAFDPSILARPEPVRHTLSAPERRPTRPALPAAPDPGQVVRDDLLSGLVAMSWVLERVPQYADLLHVGVLGKRHYTELYRHWTSLAEANRAAGLQ